MTTEPAVSKVCKRCHKELVITEFRVQKKSYGNHVLGICRDRERAYGRVYGKAYYHFNKAEILEKNNQRHLKKKLQGGEN